jgi:hypothetical protein
VVGKSTRIIAAQKRKCWLEKRKDPTVISVSIRWGEEFIGRRENLYA